ncbi:MAG: hypothetical protein ABIJ23_02930 [Candidatus Magasanikbacteria bacterium]
MKKFFLTIIIVAMLLIPTLAVHAQYGIDKTLENVPSLQQFKSVTLQTMIGNLLGGILSLVGIVFFALMVYGGVMWMSSAGNQEREKKALNTMVSAAVGVIIVLSAYVLISFVIDSSKIVGGGEAPAPAAVTAPVLTTTKETCKTKSGVEILDICEIEKPACKGVNKDICEWLDDSIGCAPKGTEKQLCESRSKTDCASGAFGQICEWK